MNIITVNKENIESEHICCAISNNNDCQVSSKKSWLSDRFQDGLVFKKADARGKCFIEYIPAEKAWAPITADGYMYIDCFWVSGQLKGQGNGNLLLEECINDSKQKGKQGLVVLSSPKKMPFLSDPGYLKHKGFIVADTAEPFYELLYLPFEKSAQKPQFKANAKLAQIENKGYVLYYSNQCPYTAKYVPLIEETAKAAGVELKTVHFNSCDEAQNAPSPSTSYCLFYNGKFITNEILSQKKFEKIIAEINN